MRAGCWLVLLLLIVGRAGAVHYGQPRDAALQELGKPVSHITRGDREILMYPRGARIELENGKVAVVVGMEVSAGPEQAGAEAAPELEPGKEEKPAEKPAEKAVEDEFAPAAPKTVEERLAAMQKQMAGQNAQAQAGMEKAIAQYEGAHDQLTNSGEQPAPRRFNYAGFAVGLGLKWLMMLAALKLTCKYWNADVDWSGLMIAATADTGVRAVVLFVGEAVLQMFSVFYADEAVGALVLVMVLRKVSTNQSLQQAITITMTSKVFSIVVGSFVVTVALRALF